MQRHLFEGRFYETYYFAGVIRNILHDQFAYLRNLDEFYGDDMILIYASSFNRWSVFHSFIEFIIDRLVTEEVYDLDLEARKNRHLQFSDMPSALEELRPSSLPINEALIYYGIDHSSFGDWLTEREKDFLEAEMEDVEDYYQDLRLEGPFDELLERATREVFFVLFQNRHLLLLFNDMMARILERVDVDILADEHRVLFTRTGVLKRVSVPRWVRRAVFYRDRGLCSICQRDLSGTLNISNREHYDHIVPLARGGLNDVTNVQLLCETCNLQKRHHQAQTSNLYQAWYPPHSKEGM